MPSNIQKGKLFPGLMGPLRLLFIVKMKITIIMKIGIKGTIGLVLETRLLY